MNIPTSISASTQVTDALSGASIASPERNRAWFPYQSTPQLNHNIWQTTLQQCPSLFVINPWQQQIITNQYFGLLWQGTEFFKNTTMTITRGKAYQHLFKSMRGMHLLQPLQRQHPKIGSVDLATSQIGQCGERRNQLR